MAEPGAPLATRLLTALKAGEDAGSEFARPGLLEPAVAGRRGMRDDVAPGAGTDALACPTTPGARLDIAWNTAPALVKRLNLAYQQLSARAGAPGGSCVGYCIYIQYRPTGDTHVPSASPALPPRDPPPARLDAPALGLALNPGCGHGGRRARHQAGAVAGLLVV